MTDFRSRLVAAQAANDSMLCVGLDPEPAKFPAPWTGDASRIFDFCAAIVDATKDLVCAFKPQIAYFAAQRAEDQLERLLAHIREVAPAVPVILDAKRGDIGATAEQYAREAFVRYRADALTLSPFMGLDSLEPYMRHDGKGLILLCRTSNPGGSDLQALDVGGGDKLYERIARLAAGEWSRNGAELALVVGAAATSIVVSALKDDPIKTELRPGSSVAATATSADKPVAEPQNKPLASAAGDASAAPTNSVEAPAASSSVAAPPTATTSVRSTGTGSAPKNSAKTSPAPPPIPTEAPF